MIGVDPPHHVEGEAGRIALHDGRNEPLSRAVGETPQHPGRWLDSH